MEWRTDELEGTTLAGRYRVGRLLGKGGMGAVYEALQLELDRPVAVKVLHPLLAADAVHVRRLEREARAAASLGHGNVVQVTDLLVGEDGHAFLVMERLHGRSLKQVLAAEGPLGVERALSLAVQVLSALDAAHRAGIVHRDVKPANVMVVPVEGLGEIAKVLDFGIAKLWEGPGYTKLTRTGVSVGTPSFMAPEQARGDPVDHRADLHAVGALLFAMLTGRGPYRGADIAEILVQVVSLPPPSLLELRPELSPALAALVARCLAKDRDERPASAEELRRELEELRRPASPPVRPGPAPTLAGPEPSLAAPTEVLRPTRPGAAASVRSRHPAWALPVALGLAVGLPLLAAVGGGLLWLGRDEVPVAGARPPGGSTAPAADGPAAPSPLSTLEQGYVQCAEPRRLELSGRDFGPGLGNGAFSVRGPCELTIREATLRFPVGLTAMSGASVLLESCRVEGDANGISVSDGGTVRLRDTHVTVAHVAVSAMGAGSSVTVIGGSITAVAAAGVAISAMGAGSSVTVIDASVTAETAVLSTNDGHVELRGTTVSGERRAYGGTIAVR